MAAVRLHILKPLNASWDEVGPLLRALRAVMHRSLNVATQEMFLIKRTGTEKAFNARDAINKVVAESAALAQEQKPTPEPKKGPSESENEFTRRHRSWLRQEADRVAKSELTRLPASIREALAQHVHKTTSADWKKILRGEKRLPWRRFGHPIMIRNEAENWNLTQNERGLVLGLKLTPGRTGQFKFAVCVEGNSDHAHARRMLSPYKAQRLRDMTKDARADGQEDLARRHEARAQLLEQTRVALGDCKVSCDRHSKWSAMVTYSWPRPPTPELDPAKVMVVHRGMRTFLTAGWSGHSTVKSMFAGGALPGHEFRDVAEIIAQWKNKFHRKRHNWYAFKRTNANGRRGHGWFKRYGAYRAMEDDEARFVKTICDQIAAEVVGLAESKGCGTLVLDDWSSRQASKSNPYLTALVKRWPFAQLRDAIERAASHKGIVVIVRDVHAANAEAIVSSEQDADGEEEGEGKEESSAKIYAANLVLLRRTCPVCLVADPKNDRDASFTCHNESCSARDIERKRGFSRSIEAVVVFNLLKLCGVEDIAKRNTASVKERGEKLRAASLEKVGGDDTKIERSQKGL